MKRVQNFEKIFQYFCNHPNFKNTYAGHFYPGFKLVEQSPLITKPQQMIIEYEVPQSICNFNNVVHGGAFATLVDITTTIAILRVDKNLRKQVTTDLSEQVLKPANKGDLLQILCDVNRLGKNLAFTDCKMYVNDSIVLTGHHTKFILQEPWDIKMNEISQQ